MTKYSRGGSKNAAQAAYTRADLITVIAMLILLGAWLGWGRTGERGRMAVCSKNLSRLYTAMDAFANDHTGALPPASLDRPRVSWDMHLRPYLRPDLAATNSPYTVRLLKRSTAKTFACPSDPLFRANMRSYAFSAHDMKIDNWPPGPDTRTGVGLRWTKDTLPALLGPGAVELAATNAAALALIKTSHIPKPADTLVLTEYVDKANTLENLTRASISSATPQLPAEHAKNTHHKGGFHFLMSDGHVERLMPYQTRSGGTDIGIWTIRADD